MFVPRSVSRKPQRRDPAKPQDRAKPQDSAKSQSPANPQDPAKHFEAVGTRNRVEQNFEACLNEERRPSADPGGSCSSEEEEDEPVISYRKQQRWPVAGEPVCVVCGRYGAYIVDDTDRDVCSLECKAKHLAMLGKSTNVCGGGRGRGGEKEGTKEERICSQPEEGLWRYTEHPAVVSMSGAQVDILRSEMSIEVKGEGMPKPVTRFSYFPLPEKVCSNLEEVGYLTPTPVQSQTIPAALTGRDLLVCAATGSGKTLSFLLPLIVRLVNTGMQQDQGSPRALVLAPTRELCVQIEEQAKQLMQGVPSMRTALVIGGLPIANQLHRLRSGVQVIVATPARLNDILENHATVTDLSQIQAFVLDEVDCLLHMGFELQVRKIEECLPRLRQNLMFSATIPPRIERMASEMMDNPLFISVGVPSAPCESVRHTIVWVEESAKRKRLIAFLSDEKLFKPPVVVFVSSKKGTLLLADAINKSCNHLSAVGIHGDMAQERRSAILHGFLEGKYHIVVGTGVLARGLDLVNVQQVFIFDMPFSIREFIHQIGRAGRLGAPGWAITFLNNENKSVFAELVDILEPLEVQLPSQLLHSPHLSLQRERRKRKQQIWDNSSSGSGAAKKMKERSFYDRESLLDLIKSASRKK